MIDPRIVKFILKHHVLTLSTSNSNLPYCASCFYTYVKDKNQLIFTSDEETKHVQDMKNQNLVAGTIALETKTVGKIQGIQFRGKVIEAKGELYRSVRKLYLKRFPFAILKETKLWIIELTYLKFTDNRLGFGKKLIWGSL